MSHETIIRAWKDESFRNSLSETERALLPANPAGLIELDDTELEGVAGGRASDMTSLLRTCTVGTDSCCC